MHVSHRIYDLLGQRAVLVPCAGKRPIEKGWRNLSLEDMTQHYLAKLESHNVGVVLGKPSNGINTLDIDSDEFIEIFEKINPFLRNTLKTKGKRGVNYWLKTYGEYPSLTQIITTDGKQVGEWRSDGGITIIEGTHPTTRKPYQYVNNSKPITISFSDIKFPPNLLIKNRNPNTPPSSELLYPKSSESTICPVSSIGSVSLYDIQKKIENFNTGEELLDKRYPRIKNLYARFIEPCYKAIAGQRNSTVVNACKFLYFCIAPRLIKELLTIFYLQNEQLFKDSLQTHEYEIGEMLKAVEATFLSSLPSEELKLYYLLNDNQKVAFRICRDFALHGIDTKNTPTFFLSCNELGSRLGVDGRQAQRIIEQLSSFGFMKCVEKGSTYAVGQKPKASTYEWQLPLPL